MKYFLITAFYQNGDKYVTRRDSKRLLNNLLQEIINEKDIIKFTVEERL